MSDITGLIARLEAATEGSREMDCEIAVHPNTPSCGIVKNASVKDLLVPLFSGGGRLVCDEFGPVPLYTTSLDAALTLVPDGWSWRCGNLPSGRHFASLGTQKSLQEIVGATAPLALCIAALKARAALHESSTAP